MSFYQSIRPRSSQPLSNSNEDDAVKHQTHPSESSFPIGKGRKRKAPAHVSQNACTNCKRARAKCDGVQGQSCSRCNSRNLQDNCQYELHVKTAKEELVRRIKDMEGTIESLQAELKEKDAWIQTMGQLFSPGTPASVVLERLQHDGSSYNSLINALSSPPPTSKHSSRISPGTRGSGSELEDAVDTDDDAPSRWTSVTQNDSKIHHLMALYFAWVHPAHMFFSERHFMDSFKNHNDVYCSSALVNAICAMGCRYFVDVDGNDVGVRRLGNRFMQQVEAELKMEKAMTPLSSVTYAIIFLIQLSEGQAGDAYSHLRLGADSLREINREPWSEEAFEITFFGINTVNINWAALKYQKPPSPILHHMGVFDNVELDRPGHYWRHYKFANDAGTRGVRTRAIEAAREFAKLALINFDTVTSWCGSIGRMTTKHILKLYQRYLSWKRDLSHALGDNSPDLSELDDNELLPYVLLLHINYHVALCQLFNPLLEYQKLSKQAKVHIRSIVIRNAQEGLGIYERFSRNFSNRYQSPLQAYYLVHLADAVLRHDRQNADKTIHFCLEQLGKALPGFPVIGPLQAMFCESILSCGLELPKDVELLMGGRSWQSYSREDKLACAERLTYAQPVDMLAEAIDPSLPETFKAEWDEFIESHGGQDSSAPVGRRASSTSNLTAAERRQFDVRAMDIDSLMNH